MASVLSSSDPKAEILNRTTRGGRTLTYALSVIQQPERARACGSGAKSSADRRPVDPPPVVELRIYEGPGIDPKKDITFSYNANFFLFATLETARPIAHGRVPQAAQQIPVLTGMPVSGMAYLDRPREAGYFIFPDLSVRHEGKYKLSFNLYEETKDAKDADVEPSTEAKAAPPGLSPNGSFDWRLEVKSMPFTVYSAKKFPGLAESTVLSRTVAEQGCRVRIRRDVRMRRRDGKAGEDYDNMDEEYSRSRRTASPADTPHDAYSRPRSISNASIERQQYPQERRTSAAEHGQQYPTGYPPAPPSAQSSSGSYLSFGASAPHYQTPQYAQPQPPSRPVQQSYPEAPQHGPVYTQEPYRLPSTYAPPEHTQQQYAPAPPSRVYYENEYRRSAGQYAPGPPPPSSHYQAPEPQYTNQQAPPTYGAQYPQRARSPTNHPPVSLAPLKMPPMEHKYDSLSSPLGPPSAGIRTVQSQPMPSPYETRERPNTWASQAPFNGGPEPSRQGKRTFDTVFNSSSLTQPLYNGMRPTSSHDLAQYDDDDSISMDALKMRYKRADGSSFSRELPILE